MSARLDMSESGHQKTLFIWAEWASGKYQDLVWLHATQGGAKMTPITAARMKAEGMRRGVPDIFLDVARGGYHGLRIELKTPEVLAIKDVSKRKPPGSASVEQQAWITGYRDRGYRAEICYGWAYARDTLLDYLGV